VGERIELSFEIAVFLRKYAKIGLAERVGVLETVFPFFTDSIRWSPTLSDSAT
jgi:hypothetical protein